MAKSQNGSSYRAELFRFDLYKRSQGRLVRQLTAVTAAVLIFFGCYTLSKGPLSGYANSYLAITARYQASRPDAVAIDGVLLELAGINGGHMAETAKGRQFREITFHFPTSLRWTTDQSLVSQQKVNSRKFADEVKAKYPAVVRVSQPRGESRRAVWISIGIPVLVCAVGLWMVFRAVNYARFADFLISVEAEMGKVSWPGKQELYRSTAVVVSTMFLLGFMLLAFDVSWKWFFELIHFLRVPES